MTAQEAAAENNRQIIASNKPEPQKDRRRSDFETAWQITPQKVQAVVQRLIEAADAKKIILFGSYVEGKVTRDSDLDVLVVTKDEVKSPRGESVRLRNAVGDINMPMDILVVSHCKFEALREKIGLVCGEADQRGRVVYESS